MPRATASITETEHCPLKTCPPDGFVDLRQLTYGEYMKRRDMATQMSIKGTDRQQRNEQLDISMLQAETQFYEFSKCIVEHNLEDASGRKLNFKSRQDFDNLDPKIGQEIDSYISKMNQWEETEKDFPEESSEPS